MMPDLGGPPLSAIAVGNGEERTNRHMLRYNRYKTKAREKPEPLQTSAKTAPKISFKTVGIHSCEEAEDDGSYDRILIDARKLSRCLSAILGCRNMCCKNTYVTGCSFPSSIP